MLSIRTARKFGASSLLICGVAAFLGAPAVAHAQQTTPAAPAAPAPAPDPDAGFLNFFRKTELSGFVDFYYDYNFNTPKTRQNQLRNFDTQSNSIDLNLAEISVNKAPSSDSRGGFRVDLDYGPTATTVNAAEPGGSTFANVAQAYVSYLAPTGSGLQVDVGKFFTPVGNEVIHTKDNWNYSRSLVFALAEPYYHAGVRAAYTVNGKVSVAGYVLNGWNDVVDNNGGKTVGGSITLKPTGAVTIAENYLGGPEQANDNKDWRHLSDTILSVNATKIVSLAANYDYGREKQITGTSVMWQGIAGYLRIQPTGFFALTPRVEYYDDKDGWSTGTPQKLKEATVTAEFKSADGVLMRLEYRRDMSDNAFFLKNDAEQVKSQDTFTVGVIYAFSTKQ
jgi:hypothetical protein